MAPSTLRAAARRFVSLPGPWVARPRAVHYTSRMKTASQALLGLLLLLPR